MKNTEHKLLLFFNSSGILIIYFGFIITGFFSSTFGASSFGSSFGSSLGSAFAGFASFFPLAFLGSTFLLFAAVFLPNCGLDFASDFPVMGRLFAFFFFFFFISFTFCFICP